MVAQSFPKDALRKIERRDSFPLIALIGVTELRGYLNAAETEAIIRARDMGATVEEMADALGLTRQGVYYRLKTLGADHGSNSHGPEVETDPSEVALIVDLDRAETPST